MRPQSIPWFFAIWTINGKKLILLGLLLVRFTVMARTMTDEQSQQDTKHPNHHHHHQQHSHHHQHQSNNHHDNSHQTYSTHSSSSSSSLPRVNSPSNLEQDDLVISDDLKPCIKCSSLDRDLFVKLKLEAIKRQILSKLQLKSQPNVTSTLPRELVLEALKRSKLDADQQQQHHNIDSYQSTDNQESPRSSSSSSSSNFYQQQQEQQEHHSLGDSQDYDSYANYNELHGDSDSSDDYYGTTSEIITFPEPGGEVNGHTLLELTPPHNTINTLEVTSANLWIQVRPRAPSTRYLLQYLETHRINLYIFRVKSNISNKTTAGHLGNLDLEMIASKKMHANRPGWKQIDLRQAVQQWFSSSTSMSSKLTLLVDCVGCESLVDFVLFDSHHSPPSRAKDRTTPNSSSGTPVIPATNSLNSIIINGNIISDSSSSNNSNSSSSNINSNSISSNSSPSSISTTNSNSITSKTNVKKFRHSALKSRNSPRFRPFLVINTKPKISKRSKRGLSTCDSSVKHCCKQSLYVNFTELGWDNWVIAPQGYYANYCVGDCSKPFRTPDVFAYHHSLIMDKYREANPYASISPCCAPTRLSAISFIYIGPRSNIVKTDLPKMIVEECGCT